MTFNIKEELKKLPGKPGVYIMHDAYDQIIYVGKAVNLKNRVRQYFQTSRNKGPKIEKMVTQIDRFEYIVTDSELEALVLECNLIKEHNPKYNTMLTDDKSYPFIKVTVGEDYPRILISRNMKKDKSRYFGPYTSGWVVKDSIELLRKLYHIRSCNKKFPEAIGKERPCLYYHIGQCMAPCRGDIPKETYDRGVHKALEFLGGRHDEIVGELKEKMELASEELKFEEAIQYRDMLSGLSKISQSQKITDSDGEDRDVIALAVDGYDAVVQVFFVREGRLIGRDHFYLRVALGDSKSEILKSFIQQFYSGTPFVPKELMIQCEISDSDVIEEWLTKKRGKSVHIKNPKRGSREKLVDLACKNAELVLTKDRERIKREEGRTIGAVKEIASLLGLEHIGRIEAYDISNISGYESVGSMVVFEKGKPKKSDYRKFRIKWVKGPNDYDSLREVLTRRFLRGLNEDAAFSRLPDLIMMDGGRGQVNVAKEVLDKMELDIPVCGMVKDDSHNTRGIYYKGEEIAIDTRSEGFMLTTRIQDEAHRFAITYHRKLRGKEQIHSVLDDIPGIGSVRRKALMKEFRSIDEIAGATLERLNELPEMNEKVSRQVYDFFHSGNDT